MPGISAQVQKVIDDNLRAPAAGEPASAAPPPLPRARAGGHAAARASPPLCRLGAEVWMTVALSMANFMEVLDVTIANVSIPFLIAT